METIKQLEKEIKNHHFKHNGVQFSIEDGDCPECIENKTKLQILEDTLKLIDEECKKEWKRVATLKLPDINNIQIAVTNFGVILKQKIQGGSTSS